METSIEFPASSHVARSTPSEVRPFHLPPPLPRWISAGASGASGKTRPIFTKIIFSLFDGWGTQLNMAKQHLKPWKNGGEHQQLRWTCEHCEHQVNYSANFTGNAGWQQKYQQNPNKSTQVDLAVSTVSFHALSGHFAWDFVAESLVCPSTQMSLSIDWFKGKITG